MKFYDTVNRAINDNSEPALAVGFVRYEAVRKLNTQQFAEVFSRSLKGEQFDDIIDELIVKND